jgi:hypothetical protein
MGLLATLCRRRFTERALIHAAQQGHALGYAEGLEAGLRLCAISHDAMEAQARAQAVEGLLLRVAGGTPADAERATHE